MHLFVCITIITTMTAYFANGASEQSNVLAVNSFNNAFYVKNEDGLGYFKLNTVGGLPTRTQFWMCCEMIEMIEDAFDATHDPVYSGMASQLLDGLNVLISGTEDFASWDIYNDDIMWAVIALARGYKITHNKAYLSQAEIQFNAVWNRGWDTKNGGLFWTTANQV